MQIVLPPAVSWVVYVVACADSSLYIGLSNDLVARLRAHNSGRGARYTRSRRPVVVVWRWDCESAEEARRLEGSMKRLGRAQKIGVVDGDLSIIAPLFAGVWSRMRAPSARARPAPRRKPASAARAR